MQRFTTRRVATIVAAAAAAALASCSSTTSGQPTASTPAAPVTSSSESTAGTDFPTDTASTAGTAIGCVQGADFCDTFDDPNSGWPKDNPSHFYADYDDYNGGTYRIGERTNAAISEDAPFDVTDAANDYSVQVDVDAELGQSFSSTDEAGIVCWEHPIEGGGGATSGFLLEISEAKATIGLWDEVDGSYHEVTSATAPGALKSSGTNHLTASCLQGTNDGGAQAQLSLSVNGTEVVSANYAKGTSNYAWGVGEKVGVLAIGEGSDVFYDNFAVTGNCAGDFC